jgi:CRISPR-associated endonuclease/helicase Cas3
MNVLFVSQCSKRALIETRRILDQFAERKGSRVWQTPITMQGLLTIKRMLRKTARRNTAVICHWIKAGNRTELLWVVGNASLFNEAGTVPTNATRRDILRIKDENLWHSIETIGLISSIAGLFHDFGKTNLKFQNMIDPPKKRNKNDKHKADPYRHEWVSLRLFQSFVGELSDREWLEKMRGLKKSDDQEILKKLKCDGLAKTDNPFKNMPPLAKIIGWLIVSHHRLPQWPPIKKIIKNEQEPQIGRIDKWLYDTKFDSAWNSTACINTDLSERDFLSIVKKVWTIKKGGLPFASSVWRRRAQRLSVLSLKNPDMINGTTDWLQKPFVMHLCRMLLMLSDHIYSSKEAQQKWQDKKYSIYANTSKGEKKQKLDEHLVGVSRDSMYFSRVLSNINHKGFPVLRNHKGFQKRNTDPRFRWQDRAYDLACSIRERSYEHGFFGVNMASTGCGKTFANGRIMYGLSNKHTGCRFNVALGLRTLTLQTGEALKQRLSLQDNDIGVLIGSRAAQKIYDFQEETKDIESSESESSKSLFEPDHYIRYEGALDNGPLGKYLRQKSDLHQLVSAPILVSTIDYLVPATESERAGKQIGPMLRLLTSDLVLDEPDDFGVDDLPALCRLVNWAGLLGSKVLISSATLPPSLIKALFDAYLSGRREFQSGWGEPGTAVDICCAWFDEEQNVQKNYGDTPGYMQEHEAFVKKRVARLKKMIPQRKGMIIPISVDEPDSMKAVKAIAMKIHENQYALHDAHGQVNATKDKKISFGLIRMANINPLVAVAKEMLTLAPPSDFHVHYCVYHSRHPLAVRSVIEKRLDSMLDRKDQQKIWSHPEIKKALSEHPETNHLFVVFATSVAEVGRDHDYDWAIVEPSSMRSLIQLAGRLLRHRKIFPTSPNLLILSQNYRSLSQNKNPDQPTIIAFEKPGFETTDFEGKFELSSHDVQNLLNKEQYESINAIPRILENPSLMPSKNLVDLEHAHLEAKLSGDGTKGKPYAALWWKHNAHWCFELQRRTRFRKPEAPDIEYLLYFRDEGETPVFHRYNDQGEPVVCENEFERVELEQPSKGISLWWKDELPEIILSLTESLDMEIETACRHFAVLRLKDESENPQWQYHPALGVFRQLD